jgi:hypothetical protein
MGGRKGHFFGTGKLSPILGAGKAGITQYFVGKASLSAIAGAGKASVTRAFLGSGALLPVIGKGNLYVAMDFTGTGAIPAIVGAGRCTSTNPPPPTGNIPGLAVVINTETMSVMEYDNFGFNSYFIWQGQVYGVASAGIYALGGPDDAGNPINATLQTALSDFGASNLKTPVDVIAEFDGPGIQIETVGDNDEVFADQTAVSNAEGLHTERVKPGRGIKSRKIGFNISNVDGGKLDLKDLELRLLILERKI